MYFKLEFNFSVFLKTVQRELQLIFPLVDADKFVNILRRERARLIVHNSHWHGCDRSESN